MLPCWALFEISMCLLAWQCVHCGLYLYVGPPLVVLLKCPTTMITIQQKHWPPSSAQWDFGSVHVHFIVVQKAKLVLALDGSMCRDSDSSSSTTENQAMYNPNCGFRYWKSRHSDVGDITQKGVVRQKTALFLFIFMYSEPAEI